MVMIVKLRNSEVSHPNFLWAYLLYHVESVSDQSSLRICKSLINEHHLLLNPGNPWAKLHETLKTGMWIRSCNLKNIFETCRKSTESALMIFDVVRCCLIRYPTDNPKLIHSECNHCWRRLGGENVILLIFPKAWRKVSPGDALSNHRENRFLVNWWPLVGICMAMLCLYTYIFAHPAVMKQGGSWLQIGTLHSIWFI